MTTWDSTHVAAANHMLKYLKYMRDEGLRFHKCARIDRLSMRIFCDANFGGQPRHEVDFSFRFDR